MEFIKFLAFFLILSMSRPAHAYLDPGVGSILLQGVIASIVVGFASIRLWWVKLLYLLGFRKKQSKFKDNTKEENTTEKDYE